MFLFTRILHYFLKNRRYRKTTIKFKKYAIRAEIADTMAKGALGLMYREKMANDEGMLFLFPFDHAWKIWMLNMRFPLDIIWLNKEKKVVGIAKNLQPCANFFSCKNYAPQMPARYVIELKAGTATRLGLKMKDEFGWK